jgi:hypothetical protein
VSADLAPGDALYIPPLWWHHVESLDSFNLLVNYWWHANPGSAVGTDSGFDTLVHGILNLRTLPLATREAWRTMFDHYVFGPEADVTEHIPAHRQGLLGKLSTADVDRLRRVLAERLQKSK